MATKLLCLTAYVCILLTEGFKQYTVPLPVPNLIPSKLSGSLLKHGNRKPVRLLAVDLVPGVGIEGCKLKSPSGVNMLPTGVQAGVFFGCWLFLGGGTLFLVNALDYLNQYFPDAFAFSKLSGAIVLGLVFILAGVSHFSLKKDFENIMPYKGAWGIWYLPGNLPN